MPLVTFQHKTPRSSHTPSTQHPLSPHTCATHNTKMESLPREILDSIVELLQEEDKLRYSPPRKGKQGLHKYATVSRSWQLAVEYITFTNLTIKSTDLSFFTSLIRPGQEHRHDLLKEINFEVVLPLYSDEDRGRRENKLEKAANNEAFSTAIHSLFRSLQRLEDHANNNKRRVERRLSICRVYSPSDRRRCATPVNVLRNRGMRDIFERRYENSYLKLSQSHELPALIQFRELYLRNDRRKVEPASHIALAAKMPNIEGLVLPYVDHYTSPALCRSLRHCTYA